MTRKELAPIDAELRRLDQLAERGLLGPNEYRQLELIRRCLRQARIRSGHLRAVPS